MVKVSRQENTTKSLGNDNEIHPSILKPETTVVPSAVGGSFIIDREVDLTGLADEIKDLYDKRYSKTAISE